MESPNGGSDVSLPVVRALDDSLHAQRELKLNWIQLIVPRSAKCFYSKMVKHYALTAGSVS